MTEQEEEYVHFVSSIDNLNKAWSFLKIIQNEKENHLIGAAFQFALIEYSKPYTRSDGTYKKGRNGYKLDTSFIPQTYIELHNKILELRNQFLAHSDLTVKEAKLYVSKIKKENLVLRVENLIFGLELLTQIDLIIELIEKTLDNLYIEEKRLELLLPINS